MLALTVPEPNFEIYLDLKRNLFSFLRIDSQYLYHFYHLFMHFQFQINFRKFHFHLLPNRCAIGRFFIILDLRYVMEIFDTMVLFTLTVKII